MKKLAIFVAAFVLTLGLAQCKKEQTPANTASEGVFITLNVGPSTGSGADGSRVQVDPTGSQQVTFAEGDRILVASGGHYVGYLQHDGTNFGGTITNPVVGQPLCFFFLGNKMDVSQLEAGSSTTCTVNISDQTNELPVLSFSESNETYNGAGTYSATLQNKCALVKFSTNVESRTVKVAGMSTVANIDFATGTITPDATTTGTVSFITDSQGEGWAILLEQGAVANAMVTATVDDTDKGCACSVPKITNNMFYSDGIQAELSAPTRSGILDAVSYAFYGDGTLYFSGSGTVSGNQFDYLDGVKKIIFDKNCTISKLNTYVYQHWNNPPLTDIEINTTVPLQLERFSIAWRMYSGTVNVTIKAPSLTLGKNATPFNCGSAVNIFIDVTEPITFEKNSMSLDNNAVVTIHSGCFCHVSGGIEFNDPQLQHEYEYYVDMGNDWMLQEFLQDHQGDYTIVEESTSELTSENAHLVFGNATVIFI